VKPLQQIPTDYRYQFFKQKLKPMWMCINNYWAP